MKVIIGADHAGYELKEYLKGVLTEWHYEVEDVGTFSTESCDYPDIACAVGAKVQWNEGFGVLIDGTGIGMSIAANKIAGIRAAVVTDEKTAELSRKHNDANVFCAGARITPVVKIAECLKVWLQSQFEGGRHLNRVSKIAALEKKT